ncbi:MAG: YHS domain-containing protein [Bacillota bacterium]
MEVDEKTAKFTSEVEGTTYYFCGPGCKRAFDADPESYVRGGAGSGEARHHGAGHQHDHGGDGPRVR